MNEKTLQLFKTLTELPGPSGNEHAVRKFMREQLSQYSDEIVQDKLGSIFAVKRGNESGPTVMVAGHMDEVGFMVTSITDNGMIRFQTLGGWWSQVLLAQRVEIITKNGPIPGVIGSIPPHLLDEEKRKKPMDIKNMLIDIGADDTRRCEKIGHSAWPANCSHLSFYTNGKQERKSWQKHGIIAMDVDWRLSYSKKCKMKHLPNILYSGATVQEEVGLRGAQTAANMIKPDLFYALDASPANDISGNKNEFGQLGKGALLRIFDRTMVTHKGMREFILDTAETHHIPYQYFASQGGTDAGRVHLSNEGVPSAVIGFVRGISIHKQVLFMLMIMQPQKNYLFN